jgi:hypothetical protein
MSSNLRLFRDSPANNFEEVRLLRHQWRANSRLRDNNAYQGTGDPRGLKSGSVRSQTVICRRRDAMAGPNFCAGAVVTSGFSDQQEAGAEREIGVQSTGVEGLEQYAGRQPQKLYLSVHPGRVCCRPLNRAGKVAVARHLRHIPSKRELLGFLTGLRRNRNPRDAG